jgi:hypothetical protein
MSSIDFEVHVDEPEVLVDGAGQAGLAIGYQLRERGLSLYFLGLSWQHTRGSALLGWVKDDAEFIAERISASSPALRAETRALAPVN